MTNHTIPLEDKEIVKQRLAQGASTREAIEGTSITSPQTASNIAKENLDEIGQIRELYIKKIKEAGADNDVRAKLWADMATATKVIGAQILIDKDGKTISKENEGAIEVPDWFAREKALRYIDALAGISREKDNEAPVVNIFNNPKFLKRFEAK